VATAEERAAQTRRRPVPGVQDWVSALRERTSAARRAERASRSQWVTRQRRPQREPWGPRTPQPAERSAERVSVDDLWVKVRLSVRALLVLHHPGGWAPSQVARQRPRARSTATERARAKVEPRVSSVPLSSNATSMRRGGSTRRRKLTREAI
jgi:hypothetical protein